MLKNKIIIYSFSVLVFTLIFFLLFRLKYYFVLDDYYNRYNSDISYINSEEVSRLYEKKQYDYSCGLITIYTTYSSDNSAHNLCLNSKVKFSSNTIEKKLSNCEIVTENFMGKEYLFYRTKYTFKNDIDSIWGTLNINYFSAGNDAKNDANFSYYSLIHNMNTTSADGGGEFLLKDINIKQKTRIWKSVNIYGVEGKYTKDDFSNCSSVISSDKLFVN